MTLSDRTIQEAQARSNVYRLRDGNSSIKGFGITIAPAGSKTFFLGYTSPKTGKRTQINIGRYPATGLEEARNKAKEYRNRLLTGVDPKDDPGMQHEPEIQYKENSDPIARPRVDPYFESNIPEQTPQREDYRSVESQRNSPEPRTHSSEPRMHITDPQTRNAADREALANWDARPPMGESFRKEKAETRATYDRSSVGNSGYARGSYFQAPAQAEVDVTHFFRKLWIRKGLIIATVLICMAATTTILFQVTPRYFAEALVLIEPRANKIMDVEAVVSGLSGDTESIQSEIQVLLSRDIAQNVILALKLDSNPEFNTSLAPKGFLESLKENSTGISNYIPKEWLDAVIGEIGKLDEQVSDVVSGLKPLSIPTVQQLPIPQLPSSDIIVKGGTRTIDNLFKKLKITQKGRSRVISVGVMSKDPNLAAEIPNVLAKLYLEQMLNQKVDIVQLTSSWLDKRIKVLQSQVEVAEAAVERYRTKWGLLATKGATVSSLQVAELSTLLIVSRSESAQASARLNQTRKLMKSPEGILSSAEVMKSPFIQKLREKEAEVQHRTAELANEYGERHPKMISARAEIKDIKSKIALEASKIIRGMENEVAIAKARERALSKNLESLKTEMAKANKAEVELRALEREATASRSLLETFLSRYKETSAQEGQDSQRADARIISAAGVPLDPSFPKKGIILALAFVGSLGLGSMLVFLVEFLDKGFRSSDQIENLTGVPVFGLVPLLTSRSERKIANSYVVQNPISPFSEAIRTIYTSLLLSHVDNPPTKILITSAQPDEGKTTTTLNLARMQAMAGRKVLIIEADLRRPGISKILNLEDKPGLVELLMGEAEIEDVLIKDLESGAFVIPAGKATQNPPTLLNSNTMSRLIDVLDEHFDVLFIDSPPVLAVSDARILATKVDATVFIVRWADTSRDMVMAAVKQLSNSTGSLAGIILSMVDLKKNSKYQYSDSFYYQNRNNKYYTYNRT